MLGEDMPLLPKFLIFEAPLCQATLKPASLRGDSLGPGLRAYVGNRVQGLQVERPSQDSEQTSSSSPASPVLFRPDLSKSLLVLGLYQ